MTSGPPVDHMLSREPAMPMLPIGRFRGRKKEPATRARDRLLLSEGDRAVYIVGDVHGCFEELLALEDRIVADAAKFRNGKLIVMLGDYVDRGPRSADVLSHLAGPPPAGFERISLVGNHEMALLDYLDGGVDLMSWLGLGSEATLASYGIDWHATEGLLGGGERARVQLREAMPASHLEFLRSLPILVETERLICVHAGLKPGVAVSDHSDHDLVWSRPSGDDMDFPKWVVHGHTPVDLVRREGRRINVDTGAFHTGRLSALRIWKGKVRILSNFD